MLLLKLQFVTTNCKRKTKSYFWETDTRTGKSEHMNDEGTADKGGALCPWGQPALYTRRGDAGLRSNEWLHLPENAFSTAWCGSQHLLLLASNYGNRYTCACLCVHVVLQTIKSKSIFSPQNPLIESMLPQRAADQEKGESSHINLWGANIGWAHSSLEGRKKVPPKWHLPPSEVPLEASHELRNYILVPSRILQDTFIYRVPTIEIWQPLFKCWQDIKAPLFFNV